MKMKKHGKYVNGKILSVSQKMVVSSDRVQEYTVCV